MNWSHSLGTLEYILVGIFILLYVLYLVRTIRIARKMNTHSRTLLLKLFLRFLAFALILLSIAGPIFGEVERKLMSEGKDIYFAVDVSRSMDATDIAPSRIEKSKFELLQIIPALAPNRMGLIAFSNEAYVQSPLTFDANALSFMVQSLQTNIVPNGGTDLCTALNLAQEKMAGGASLNKSKIIVIFSDGEGTTDCKAELNNLLRKLDFNVFIVAVGTKSGSSITLADGSLLKKENGETVISRLNEVPIQRMVENLNGSYFRIGNEQNEMRQLVSAIRQVQGHLVDSRSVDVTSNKYYYFLGLALLLLILDVLITVRTFRV